MEILFENPIFLIAILWAIASFFNKSKASNSNQQQKNARPEARTSEQQIQPKPNESRKVNSPRSRLEQMAKEMADRLEKEYMEKRQIAESTRRQATNHSSPIEKQPQPVYIKVEQPVEKKVVVEEKTIASQHSYSIEKQKIIDGVVWAEILGPPRALNPHRSLKRKS